MIQAFFSWMFQYKFVQQTGAAVVGTGLTAGTMFGVLDSRLTTEIKAVHSAVEARATVVYVDHKNEVVTLNVNGILKTLDRIEKAQDETNKRLYELKGK